jgi:hypothetical protein
MFVNSRQEILTNFLFRGKSVAVPALQVYMGFVCRYSKINGAYGWFISIGPERIKT